MFCNSKTSDKKEIHGAAVPAIVLSCANNFPPRVYILYVYIYIYVDRYLVRVSVLFFLAAPPSKLRLKRLPESTQSIDPWCLYRLDTTLRAHCEP